MTCLAKNINVLFLPWTKVCIYPIWSDSLKLWTSKKSIQFMKFAIFTSNNRFKLNILRATSSYICLLFSLWSILWRTSILWPPVFDHFLGVWACKNIRIVVYLLFWRSVLICMIMLIRVNSICIRIKLFGRFYDEWIRKITWRPT